MGLGATLIPTMGWSLWVSERCTLTTTCSIHVSSGSFKIWGKNGIVQYMYAKVREVRMFDALILGYLLGACMLL